MLRVNLNGKGQALDGDMTSTGAVCIASGINYQANDRAVLRQGDSTTPCPVCGEVGTVVEGVPWFVSYGRPVAVDGALVACGCPSGSNRVVAPLDHGVAAGRARLTSGAFKASNSPSPAPAAASMKSNLYAGQGAQFSALEPGFYIVPRSMSGPQVLARLLSQDSTLPIARLQRLNPTFEHGFKAGEIFVVGNPDNLQACTHEEALLMQAAERARGALATLSEAEANFMMEHIGEIAGVLSGASSSMGVGKDMLDQGLGRVKDTLKGIEALHQRQFILHGHLHSPEFFTSRQALYKQLSAQLSSSFLHKRLNLGGYETLRRDLGISPKSLVHHWKKAGGPGQIPGYATHLDEVAKTARYLKYGGYVAIGLGATASYLKVQEACRSGETDECRKVRFTETGAFSGSLVAGFGGGIAAGKVANLVCHFGVWGKAVCGIALVGAGSVGAAEWGGRYGEYWGELLYEASDD